jgi:hypothetical protein
MATRYQFRMTIKMVQLITTQQEKITKMKKLIPTLCENWLVF